MKKIFVGIIILLIVYIGIQLVFHFFGTGHKYEYCVNNGEKEFLIKEQLVRNTKNEQDSYYFEIKVDDVAFSYQTFESFENKNKIITNIKYYKDDNYICILPVFLNEKILSDIKCLRDDIIYNYHDIKDKNAGLQQFGENLIEYDYVENNWIDDATAVIEDNIDICKDNLIDNHYVSFNTYKGIYTIKGDKNSSFKKTNLFTKDIYVKPISVIFEKYYVVADYNSQYRFNMFYIVDLINQKVTKLDFGYQISFDSYIQGIIENSIYLFDKNSKKQYEINLKTNKVLEVGNEKSEIEIYQNGSWSKISASIAKNDVILFDSKYKSDIEDNKFERIDKVGGAITGYYYFYQKHGSEYLVYRAHALNINQLTYLYKTTDINRINYIDDFIYYIYDNEIRYFNENIGVRTIIKNEELSFNNNLVFGVYVK